VPETRCVNIVKNIWLIIKTMMSWAQNVPPGKCRRSTSIRQVLSNSASFIYHPNIRHHIVTLLKALLKKNSRFPTSCRFLVFDPEDGVDFSS
jgi:hypothetical protein